METSQFDRLTRTLAAGASRRGVMRGLAAGLVAAAAGGTTIADIAAKKKRPNKPNKPNKTCKPGTVVASVSVPATGGTATTPNLKSGQRYRLVANGFWATNAEFGNDAVASFPFNDPTKPVLEFEGVRLGLTVDGGSPNLWGAYTTGHTYEQIVTGQGRSLQLRYADKVYSDNSGTLTVDVICA